MKFLLTFRVPPFLEELSRPFNTVRITELAGRLYHLLPQPRHHRALRRLPDEADVSVERHQLTFNKLFVFSTIGSSCQHSSDVTERFQSSWPRNEVNFLLQVFGRFKSNWVFEMAGSGESEAVVEDLSPVRPVNGRVVLLQQVRYFLPVLFVIVYPEMLKNCKIQLLIRI